MERHDQEVAKHQAEVDRRADEAEKREDEAKKINWNDLAEKELRTQTDDIQAEFLSEYSVKSFNGWESEQAAMFRHLVAYFTDWSVGYIGYPT